MTQITYACASMAQITSPERRRINLDFKLEGSNYLNKVVFLTTSRFREYDISTNSDIPQQELNSWPWHSHVRTSAKGANQWIGKGYKHRRWSPGRSTPWIRIDNTAASLKYIELEGHPPCYHLQTWIESWHIELLLTPSTIKEYPYKGEFRSLVATSVKGEWK